MGAQEVQRKRVVHPRHRSDGRLDVDQVLAPPPGALAPGLVQEAAPGHGDQPPLRIPGRRGRPGAKGLDQRVLHGILCRREIGAPADQGTDHARDQDAQPGRVQRVHQSVIVGGAAMIGRTSSHSWIGRPPAPGAADSSPANSRARS